MCTSRCQGSPKFDIYYVKVLMICLLAPHSISSAPFDLDSSSSTLALLRSRTYRLVYRSPRISPFSPGWARRPGFANVYAMSSSTSPPKDLIEFLHSSFPTAVPATTSEADLPNHISQHLYPETSYTDNEKVEISQWLTTSSHLAAPDEDEAKQAERLGSLNLHLSTRTTLLGSKPSVADAALFYRLAPAVRTWTAQERTGEHGYHHVVRYLDFVQNAPLFGLSLSGADKVDIDANDVRFIRKPVDAKEEKERKKKEKAAAAATTAGSAADGQTPLVVDRVKGQAGKDKGLDSEPQVKATADGATPQQSKKEKKKEKAPKPAKQAPTESPLSPHLIDLRVGHILKAIPHPNADSLYVSTIACGDPPGTDNTSEHEGQVVRTVCSGLNGLVPLEEMQGRKIIAVCNLKPVTMRGVKSAAMVLAASPRLKDGEEDNHKGPVELVTPPDGAEAGERVCFDGWEGEPEGVLNPKKKVWESLQPGFTTTDGREVGFEPGVVEALKDVDGDKGKGIKPLVTRSGGKCTVQSLTGAVVR